MLQEDRTKQYKKINDNIDAALEDLFEEVNNASDLLNLVNIVKLRGELELLNRGKQLDCVQRWTLQAKERAVTSKLIATASLTISIIALSIVLIR